ncbi:MAG: murein biosynthesis integral membrane protein MurJ, partial [Verrucomicrobiota bacterium]
MALLKSMATVSGFTLMSRVLGLVREMILGAFLGTGMVADAFVAAFRLPNMFRRIFGEGAFNSAFVPLFGRELEENGDEQADHFASQTFSMLTLVLVVGTLVAIPAMPFIMDFFAPGFRADPGKFATTVAMGRIMFSYLLCMALSAHLSGVLNTIKVFGMPAFAPVLLNLIFITALIVFVPVLGIREDLPAIGVLISWAVCLAGFVQLIVLYVTCRSKGRKIRLVIPRLSPKIKRLFVLMVPGILAAGIQQINLLVGTRIASSQDGANSFIYYSDRINQLPLGMIGIAFGVVLLPDITRKLRAGRKGDAITSMNRGMEMAMLITLPAAVAMVAIAEPIISAIYQRANFTAESSRLTAMALQGFALGLPAYVLVRVLQPGYFAQEDTKRPMIMAAITVLVNIVFSLILFRHYQHVGITIATSIAGWVNVLLLFLGLEGFLKLDRQLLTRLPRMLLASVVMGAVLYGVQQLLGQFYAVDGQIPRIIRVSILVVTGL